MSEGKERWGIVIDGINIPGFDSYEQAKEEIDQKYPGKGAHAVLLCGDTKLCRTFSELLKKYPEIIIRR